MTSSVSAQIMMNDTKPIITDDKPIQVDPLCLQNCANAYISCTTSCGPDFNCIQNCNIQAMACDKSCGMLQAAVHNIVQVDPLCLQQCANAYISCSSSCGPDFNCIQNCNTQAMACDKSCGALKVHAQRNITGEVDDECSTCCSGCEMDFTKRTPTCDDDIKCIRLNKAFRGVCYDECHKTNTKCTC